MSSSTKDDGGMKKFLFDTIDFDEPEVVDNAPTFSEEQVALAREEGYKQGYAKGHSEGHDVAARAAYDAVEEKLRVLLDGITLSLGQLTSGEDRREMEKCIDAARIALHIVHKLMPQLAAQHGLPEIERVISSAIDARRDEPRIAITVTTALLEPLRARIDQLARDRGFNGKLIVIADDSMAPSDCRVEWADGGSERIASRLMMQIENEFSRAIAGMQGALEPTAHHDNETDTEQQDNNNQDIT